MNFFFIYFTLLCILMLFHSKRLLLSLLTLEILRFLTLIIFSLASLSLLMGEFLFLFLFVIFVIEGVLALSGLVSLVRSSGFDYVSSFGFLKV